MSDVPCPACGSSNVISNVRVRLTAETGSVGLAYKTLGIVIGVEPLLADLCSDCGTVVRFGIKDANHKWWTTE
jgi:hypothetical protein